MSIRNRGIRAALVLCFCLSVAGSFVACREEAPAKPAAPAESTASRPPSAPESPNLVIITLDTTRADALGAYGQSLKTSPVFDRLAAEGTLFADVMTSSPETVPAHASIFTGKYPFAHGVRGNSGYILSKDHLTLAEVLNSAGYVTGAEIAAVVLREETQISQGFSTVRDTSSEGVRLKALFRERDGEVKAEVVMVRDGSDITDSGIDFIRKHRERKFFLWLHYFDVHAPYSSPPQFRNQIPGDPYHAGVAYQDSQMGRFIAVLERLGLRENTLVIVTSDHGEGLLEHGERTHSYFLYDTTMRVPMIFWGLKQVSGGKRIESLVRTVDIAPTALELLGLYPLYDIDGVSLAPLLGDLHPALDLTAYGEASRVVSTFNISPLRFVREGRWKYIYKVNPELYDVEADPGELDNRIDAEPDVAARLHERLEAILATAPAKSVDSFVELTHQVESQLRALGYVEASGGKSFASDGESLELFGEDPTTKTEDMDLAAFAVGAVIAKKWKQAIGWAEPLWRRNPDSPLATNLLSESYEGVNRWSDAIPLLRRSIEFNPQDVRIRERLITALAAVGRNQDAISELLSLNLDRACNQETLSMLNQLLHVERRFEEQRDVIGAAVVDCAEVPANVNNYAWFLATVPDAELRDGARAIALIRQAISSLGHRDPAFLDTLAAALAEQGRFEEAIRVESEVIEMMREGGAPSEVLREFRDHLEDYRAESPLRDPSV